MGHRNLEETIFKTNLEAAQAICRQLRLRNLGGIIIIDFIDMTEEEHKRQVLRALEKCLARDHAKTHITEVSVARPGGDDPQAHPGVPRARPVRALPLLRRARLGEDRRDHLSTRSSGRSCARRASSRWRPCWCWPPRRWWTVCWTRSRPHLAELEEFIGRPIRLQAESLYTQEQYDVVLI